MIDYSAQTEDHNVQRYKQTPISSESTFLKIGVVGLRVY